MTVEIVSSFTDILMNSVILSLVAHDCIFVPIIPALILYKKSLSGENIFKEVIITIFIALLTFAVLFSNVYGIIICFIR